MLRAEDVVGRERERDTSGRVQIGPCLQTEPAGHERRGERGEQSAGRPRS